MTNCNCKPAGRDETTSEKKERLVNMYCADDEMGPDEFVDMVWAEAYTEGQHWGERWGIGKSVQNLDSKIQRLVVKLENIAAQAMSD